MGGVSVEKRRIPAVATVLLAGAAALLIAPFLMRWAVVEVRTPAPDAVDVTLPVPLNVLRLFARLAPSPELPGHLRRHVLLERQRVIEALRALDGSPDGSEFLSVTSPEAKVTFTKQDGRLLLDVDADGTVVHCRLPLDATIAALERWDGERVQPRVALDLVAAAGRGELFSVDGPDATVRVRIW
jgi:hypothetical protein